MMRFISCEKSEHEFCSAKTVQHGVLIVIMAHYHSPEKEKPSQSNSANI